MLRKLQLENLKGGLSECYENEGLDQKKKNYSDHVVADRA